MKIKFLGTAAAEGVPAVFCNCDNCKHARETGGKNIRTRSQILIDDDMLFDFPMDTYMHALRFGIDLSKITRVLISHAHMDHCYPQEFCMRGGPFAKNLAADKVTVYCDATVREMFLSDTAREIRPEVAAGIDVVTLHPYDEGKGDTRIIALPARHTKGEECLVYYVERGGAGAMFVNDTGALDSTVYEKLAAMGGRVAFASFDCTYGKGSGTSGRHMGIFDVVDQVNKMRAAKLLAPNAVLYATHFSHNSDLDYEGMKAVAAEYGINVSYDGCEVTVNA